MEERSEGTKGKSPKQGLASAKDRTIELLRDVSPRVKSNSDSIHIQNLQIARLGWLDSIRLC